MWEEINYEKINTVELDYPTQFTERQQNNCVQT
jgi:hypothetical protein